MQPQNLWLQQINHRRSDHGQAAPAGTTQRKRAGLSSIAIPTIDSCPWFIRRKPSNPSYLDFDEGSYSWTTDIGYREHPELYRAGKGEQGALICEPYKSEIGQYWRFKTPDIAEVSSKTILEQFEAYLKTNDFVGADTARKYLQMGYTRARRYANYKGGKKYDTDKDNQQLERGTGDPEKAEAARIFHLRWKAAEANELYSQLKKHWKRKKG